MFDNIEIMQTAQAMARHASHRQTLVAANVANADTPGYRARDLAPFAETYGTATAPAALRATRAGHLDAGRDVTGAGGELFDRAEASPNGNSVSLENEMIKSTELRHQHDMALAIYGKARDILRTSLGRK